MLRQEELRAVANLYSDIKATRPLSTLEDAQMTHTFDLHIGGWGFQPTNANYMVPHRVRGVAAGSKTDIRAPRSNNRASG